MPANILASVLLVLIGGTFILIFVIPPEQIGTKKGIAVVASSLIYAAALLFLTVWIWGNIGLLTYFGLVTLSALIAFAKNGIAVIKNAA